MARRVVAIVSDLFFVAKIAATAEAAGILMETLDLEAARARFADATAAEARVAGPPGAAPASGEVPALLILDLGSGEPAIALARALRHSPDTARIPLVGFYSHVDQATREAALAAGIDLVLPRSAFVARLPALLRGE